MRNYRHSRRKMYACIATSIASLAMTGGLQGAVTTAWNTATGGNFNTPGDWTMGVPGSADTAQFNIANTYTVSLDVSPSITSMSVGGSNVTFANSVSGRTFSISSTLNVNSGGMTLNAATPITMTVSNNSGFNAPVSISNGNQLSLSNAAIGSAHSSNMSVTGPGSSLSAGSIGLGNGSGTTGTLSFSNSASGTLGDVSIATFSAGTGNLFIESRANVSANGMNLATNAIPGTSASVTLTGSATLTQGGGTVSIGASSASQGTMIVSSGGTAVINGGLAIYSTGELDVQSGGIVNVSTPIYIYSGSGTRGNLVVSTGSSVSQTFGALLVGSATGNTAKLQIDSTATFTTSTFAATVNPTGLIDINGGTFNENGGVTVDGGTLQRGSGTFAWASSKTMTVQNGGQVNFTGSYTLPASATVDISDSGSAFAVSSGSTLTVPSNSQITLNAGQLTAPTLAINSGGSVHYNGGNTSIGNLQLASTGVMTVASGGDKVLRLSTLSIDSTAKLDLNDNDLVVNSGDFSTIQNLVFAGYRDHVDTAATGIVSSTSQASSGKTILALFDNALVGRTDWPAGSGQTISSSAIVGKYTYFGDTNLDGQVTGDDYGAVDANLGSTGLNPGNAWLLGDTNGDLSVTGDDYASIDANLGLGVGNPLAVNHLSPVPEPAGVLMIGAGLLALGRSRRRRMQ